MENHSWWLLCMGCLKSVEGLQQKADKLTGLDPHGRSAAGENKYSLKGLQLLFTMVISPGKALT